MCTYGKIWMIKYPEKDDMDDIHNLEVCCFKQPWSKAMLEENFSLDNYFFVAATVDGYYVAYMMYMVIAGEVTLNRICVLPQYRRMGIAEALIKLLPDNMDATLEVDVNNIGAIRLYQKNRFTIEGKRKGYYGCNRDGYILWRRYEK